ncbi:MAG TPA: hypothetical protein VH482_35635, partial [Thermomicrobiales bacterium]
GLDGALYFTDGAKIYRTLPPGTAGGTSVVATLLDLQSFESNIPSGADHLTTSGGLLFFIGDDVMRRNELWAYNPQSPRRKLRMIRSLLSDATLHRGRLAVQGTRWSDKITVAADAQAGTVTVSQDGLATQTFALRDVGSVLVSGGAEYDDLTLAGPVPRATLSGGGGGDQLTGGELDDVLQGDQGDDRLVGGTGNDDLFGGAGKDTLDGGAGRDVLSGGDDSDTVDYAARTRNLAVSLDGLRNDGERREGDNVLADVETVWGGAGNDYLVGSATGSPKGRYILYTGEKFVNIDDALLGNGGEDTLMGGGGGDSLIGGNGDDSLDGGAGGDDVLRGDNEYATEDPAPGSDTLSGRNGDDTLYGNEGDDLLVGGNGSDSILGGDGNDDITGHRGNDVLHGDDGNDTLAGNDDDDELWGDAGNDLIDGGYGDDDLNDGAGDDTLYGGFGNDTIGGVEGADLILAGDGDDVLFSRDGIRDRVDGGPGYDYWSSEDIDKSSSIEELLHY